MIGRLAANYVKTRERGLKRCVFIAGGGWGRRLGLVHPVVVLPLVPAGLGGGWVPCVG